MDWDIIDSYARKNGGFIRAAVLKDWGIDIQAYHCYTNCTRTASTVRRDDMVHLDYRDSRPIYTQIIDGFK